MVKEDTGVAGGVLKARQKALSSLKRYLEEEGDAQWGSAISRYCIVEQNRNSTTAHCYDGPCHSQLNRHTDILAMSTSPHVNVWEDPGLRADRGSEYVGELEGFFPKAQAYWEYLVHKSPWRDVFLTKCLEEAVVKGVLINTELPANFVMQGIIGTREPHEYPNRVELWYDVVQAGGDPDLMFPIMECLHHSEFHGVRTLKAGAAGGIHDMFCSQNWGSSTIQRFLRGELLNPRQPLRTSGCYGGIHDLYHNMAGRELRDALGLMPKTTEVEFQQYWRNGYRTAKSKVTGYDEGVQYLVKATNNMRKKYG